jgi:uncharacterized protein YjiS (DUF1127 family)
MEGAMPEDDADLEYLRLNYRRLTPEGHSRLCQLVMERAKDMRAAYLRGLWRQLVAWYQARVAVAQERALDDAALKDIGLHRSGIEAAVVNGMAKTEPPPTRPFPEKPQLWLQRTG